MTKSLLPSLALATLGVLVLGGCGGSPAPSASSSAAAPASSAAEPSASTAPSAGSPSTASTTSAEAKDPCDVLSASKVSDLTGVKVGNGKGGGASGSSICSWAGGKAGSTSYVIFTGQEGPAVGGSLQTVGDQLKGQFGGTVDTITVTGADEAIYLSGTKNDIVVDVLARRGEVFYQVLATTPGSSASKYKDGTIKLAEALIAG